jgi:hypothetical protein
LWFARVESCFAAHQPAITVDNTKFAHVVQLLDGAAAAEVRSIILTPPANDRYKAIKDELLKVFGRTQASKDRELLHGSGLGDRKPTAMLRHMQALGSDLDTLMKALFLERLPVSVRTILATSKGNLAALAEEADQIFEASVEGLGGAAIGAVGRERRQRPNALVDGLCFIHKKWGNDAKNCAHADCRMAKLCPKGPAGNPSGTGNAGAGRN